MRLERFTRNGDRYTLRFEDGDDGYVEKIVRASGSVLENRRTILLRVREAERDLVFMRYGDKWREHVGSFFTGPETDEERAMLDVILGC